MEGSPASKSVLAVDGETRVQMLVSNGSSQLGIAVDEEHGGSVPAAKAPSARAQSLQAALAAPRSPGGPEDRAPGAEHHAEHGHGEEEDPDKPPLEDYFSRDKGFFLALLAALVTGALLGLLCLGYLKAAKTVPEMLFQADGNEAFPDDTSTLSWAAGKPWWIAVGAGVGLFHGVVKALTHMDAYPSILKEMQAKHVDPWMSCRVFVLCMVSILGGAPIGPEAGLGSMGMLFGQTVAQLLRRFQVPGHEGVDPAEFTIVGAAAALSPVVPSPLLAMILCGELSGWPTSRQATLWFAGAMASFAAYWSIMDTTYINPVVLAVAGQQARTFTPYDFAIALLFGLMGAVVSLAYFLLAGVAQGVFGALKQRLEARLGRPARVFVLCTLSGTIFGVFNYLFPLSVGSGELVLGAVIGHKDISSGLLVSSAAIKALSYWVCASGGIVGGFMLPLLSIGTMVGSAVADWTGLNRVLAISSSFAAVAAGFCPIPVFLVFLTYVCFPVSQLMLFTVTCTVFTAYWAFVGVGVPHALMERAAARKNKTR